MPDDTPFPDYLSPIIDAAVAHVLDEAPLPPHLEELESWLELNDPECLCENYTELVPKGLLEEKFVDDEVREWMCVDENSPLTDQDRLDFAKNFIYKLLRDGPSWGTFEGIHSYGIKDSRGRSALLGIRTYGPGGQHGFHWDWWGVFPDWDAVCRLASKKNYWLGAELEEKKLMDLWR